MKLRINQLSTLLGLSHTSIIYYEKRNIINPIRLSNGYREYSFEDIMTLKKVILLRNLGLSSLTIEEILQNKSINMETTLINQSKIIKENIQKELRLISLIDEVLTLCECDIEEVKVAPFFITKEPSCNIEHTIISDNPSAKELIRNMPFSFFHWYINSQDVLDENYDRLKDDLDLTYRAIRFDDALINEINTEGLDLIPAMKCIRIVLSLNDIYTYIPILKEYLITHNMISNFKILIRSSTMNTVLYENETSPSIGEIFIPI